MEVEYTPRPLKDILNDVDPLRGETPAPLFYDAAFTLLEYEAKRRGLVYRELKIAVAVYGAGRHKFLFDAEAAAIFGVDTFDALRADVEAAAGELAQLEGPGALIYSGKFGEYLKRRDLLRKALVAAADTLGGPALISLPGAGIVEANDALAFGPGFPLPADFREAYAEILAAGAPTGEVLTPPVLKRPEFINIAGDLELYGRGADVTSIRKRLTRRGKSGVKHPEFQRAAADLLPLLDPPLTSAGWPMLLYTAGFAALIINGDVGIYEGGDWYYGNKRDLYDVIGSGRLDKRTRRAGLADLTAIRPAIRGYVGGHYHEYTEGRDYTEGDHTLLGRIMFIDPYNVRVDGRRRKHRAFTFNPIFRALIREAFFRVPPGGRLYVPTKRLDALIDHASGRTGPSGYGGLVRMFLDVLRNRTKESYTRQVETVAETLAVKSFSEIGPDALRDAIARSLDILGEAEILSKYDIDAEVNKVIIWPGELGRGETKELF